MRILILTSSLYGTASHHLDYIIDNPDFEIKMVIFNEGRVQNKKGRLFKKIRKVLKIGILGALNGLRMRQWYDRDIDKYILISDLKEKCYKQNIPFYRTEAINSETTEELFRKADCELGISLGNGYIPKKIFSIPQYGMINIHHEVLPQFQNAQSIIWQLYKGSSNTGYTIHKIEKQIDTGGILYQEIIPITIRETFADTVTYTFAELLKHSAIGLVKVLENFNFYLSESRLQDPGTIFTTPTIWQYLRMEKQFKKLRNSK